MDYSSKLFKDMLEKFLNDVLGNEFWNLVPEGFKLELIKSKEGIYNNSSFINEDKIKETTKEYNLHSSLCNCSTCKYKRALENPNSTREEVEILRKNILKEKGIPEDSDAMFLPFEDPLDFLKFLQKNDEQKGDFVKKMFGEHFAEEIERQADIKPKKPEKEFTPALDFLLADLSRAINIKNDKEIDRIKGLIKKHYPNG